MWWRRPGRGALHGPGPVGATMGAMIYRVLHTVVPPVAKAVWRPTVTGLEHVPRSRGGDPGQQPPLASSTAW